MRHSTLSSHPLLLYRHFHKKAYLYKGIPCKKKQVDFFKWIFNILLHFTFCSNSFISSRTLLSSQKNFILRMYLYVYNHLTYYKYDLNHKAVKRMHSIMKTGCG